LFSSGTAFYGVDVPDGMFGEEAVGGLAGETDGVLVHPGRKGYLVV